MALLSAVNFRLGFSNKLALVSIPEDFKVQTLFHLHQDNSTPPPPPPENGMHTHPKRETKGSQEENIILTQVMRCHWTILIGNNVARQQRRRLKTNATNIKDISTRNLRKAFFLRTWIV